MTLKDDIIINCMVCIDWLEENYTDNPTAKFDIKLLRHLDYDKLFNTPHCSENWFAARANKLDLVTFKHAQAIANFFYKQQINEAKPIINRINRFHKIGLWRTKDAKLLWIDEMDVNHLQNIVKIFSKNTYPHSHLPIPIERMQRELRKPERQEEIKERKAIANTFSKIKTK